MQTNFLYNIKSFFQDIIQHFKNKMFSSKYVVKGKCKRCGQCCSTILFSDENGYIKTPEDFIKLQKRNPKLFQFTINGIVNDVDKDNPQFGALLFKCKALKEDGRCSQYFFRSFFCRDYPAINSQFIQMGGTTLDGCGYYFDVDKKFKEYLK